MSRKRKADSSLESPPEKKKDASSHVPASTTLSSKRHSPSKSIKAKPKPPGNLQSKVSSSTLPHHAQSIKSSKHPPLSTSSSSKRSSNQPTLDTPPDSSAVLLKKTSPSKAIPSSKSSIQSLSSSSTSNAAKHLLSSLPSSTSSQKLPVLITPITPTENISLPKKRKSKRKKSKKSNYDHLSEEEKIIVVGFTPSPKKSSDLPLHSVSKTRGSSSAPSSCAVSTSRDAAPLAPSTLSGKSSTTVSSSSPCPPLNKTSTRIPSISPSTSLSSVSDCSLLMEVKKGGERIFINPFFSSTSPTQNKSVIVIEDSPNPQSVQNGSPVCTSTPRPSIGAPVFNNFPSPIVNTDRTFQIASESLNQSQESSFLQNRLSRSTHDVTVINKSNAGHEAQNCVDDQNEIIFIDSDSDTLINATNRDEEDMEIDDEVAIITLNDARENTMLLESETVGILTETVAQKSAILESSEYCDAPGSIIVVIDTNVFIRGLRPIIDLLKHPLALSGRLFILLPWVVLQELDYLKQYHKDIRIQCMAAVRFINEQLLADNPQLLSQSPQQATEKLIPIESNDDKIIICCLQRQKKFVKDRVILVTRDINLSSKAMVSGIESADDQTVWRKLLTTSTSTVRNGGTSTKQSEVQSVKNKGLRPNVQGGTTTVPQPLLTLPVAQIRPQQLVQPTSTAQSDLHHPRFSNDRVHKKLCYIWDLISFIWSDVNYKSPPTPQVNNLVKNVFFHTEILQKQFERCLGHSPIHIRNFHMDFQILCKTLNNFTKGYDVPYPDRTEFILKEDLLVYFEEVNNRPQIYSGLQTLKKMIHDFQATPLYATTQRS